MSVVTGHAPTELMYFGKVPSRGDFVRSSHHPVFVDQLDRWQSQVMERLATDPRWKQVYDQAPPLSFAIIGSGNRVGLAGHWLPSGDTSGRRFPFVAAASFGVEQPRHAMVVAPVALERLWLRVEQVARVAHAATALEHAQASLATPLDNIVDVAAARRRCQEFMDSHTLASLNQMLQAAGHELPLRPAMLALGLLLLPAVAQGTGKLHKVLRLPLPQEPSVRTPVAAWWLSLVMGFFDRHELELGLFIAAREQGSELLVGFQGASATAMLAAIDDAAREQHAVSLQDSDWVEDEVMQDAGLRKLSNYLRDPGLSLGQALTIYREVFLGV
ncbi:MAG: type VI secretion system-associated protein TagF [Aquabacterium sp.]|jgi:type VI secretion system protein ImpM